MLEEEEWVMGGGGGGGNDQSINDHWTARIYSKLPLHHPTVNFPSGGEAAAAADAQKQSADKAKGGAIRALAFNLL
jgi:hypothetical protein